MKIFIEIRAGEGGDDAKMLVMRQTRIYLKYARRKGLTADIIQDIQS